jgi:hemerythrin superfamily protein
MLQITAKELDFIADALALEELVYKKAKIYSNTLTDENLAEVMQDIAERGASRFTKLIGLLGGKVNEANQK